MEEKDHLMKAGTDLCSSSSSSAPSAGSRLQLLLSIGSEWTGPSAAQVAAMKTPWEECKSNYHHEGTSYFAAGGDLPKVQVPFKTLPDKAPRELVEERCRREYLVLDLEQLLAEKGIESNSLMPRDMNSAAPVTLMSDNTLSSFLPLEIFDNEDYDCRTPEDWLALGKTEGSDDQKPIPAKALLPKDTPESQQPGYSWELVGVLDYCKEKCQYLVQKVLQHSNLEEEEVKPYAARKHTKKMNSFHGGWKHWVPRIRLLFKAEDPRVFAERIHFALRLRKNAEKQLLWDLTVDCMPIQPGDMSLCEDTLHRIRTSVQSARGFEPRSFERCVEEVKLEHGRVMNRMEYDKTYEELETFFPQRNAERVPQDRCLLMPPGDFEKRRAEFGQNFLLNLPEMSRVIAQAVSECQKVSDMKLFNVTLPTPVRLEEYERLQCRVHYQISHYLKEEWIPLLSRSMLTAQKSLAKGCRGKEFYIPMFRLMKLVIFRIRSSLRSLVLDSLDTLADLVLEACHSVLECPQDLVWGSDLISSPYKPEKKPLYRVSLVMDQSGVHYNPPLEDFETFITKIFQSTILVTHNLPPLHKSVMEELDTMDSLSLQPMSFHEKEIKELEEKVRMAQMKAAIPLRAYAAEYEKYLDHHNLDLGSFKSDYADQSFQEVKMKFKEQLEEKEKLESSLPTTIDIGPFSIYVGAIKQTLVCKHSSLTHALLGNLALMLRNQIEKACENCETISRRLSAEPHNIEELSEKREWMKHIPEELETYKDVLVKILLDYDGLEEEFCYRISDEDDQRKWTAIWWPKRIIKQMETVSITNEEDEKHFRRIQLEDQRKFEEQLDSLQGLFKEIAAYPHIDIAHKKAKKARRAINQLEHSQHLGETLKTRQLLLGLPDLNLDRLQKLGNDFQPLCDLWITTSDWLIGNERWLNLNLSVIDTGSLEPMVTDAHKALSNCIQQLEGYPDFQIMAKVMLSKVEEFQLFSHVIQCLKNPEMKSCHWEMISERINIKVKPIENMSLNSYMELGLQKHLDVIASIAEAAAKEHSIQQ